MEEYIQRDIYAKKHTRSYIHIMQPTYERDIYTKRHNRTYI